ncbi:MAG: Flp pilus assembly complex ATPase component TadA [Planctomycetes bacterium]|nr:Flp pilus assembly complex ATPase component TadA [Planctomycetota bacterium]
MNPIPEALSAPAASSGVEAKPRAYISVEENSAEQVVLSRRRGPVAVSVQLVREDGIDILSPVFLPKNAELKLEFTDTADLPKTDKGGLPYLIGSVRKVKMISAQPLYQIYIELVDSDSKLLHALWLRCNAITQGDTKAKDGSAELEANLSLLTRSVPAWAVRLVRDGVLNEQQLTEVLNKAAGTKLPLDRALLNSGAVLDEQIACANAMELGVPYANTLSYEICSGNNEILPRELIFRNQVFPLFSMDGILTLGMVDPMDLAVIDQVRLRTNSQVDPCLLAKTCMQKLLESIRRQSDDPTEVEAKVEEVEETTEEDELEAACSSNEIVRLVNSIIEESAVSGVSDIHIEPERDLGRVRVRVDGILHEKSVHPRQQHAPIVSRLKVMSKLDIADTRRPQDGHFGMKISQGNIDVRVSTIPTVHGENVVMRLLLSGDDMIGLDDLGIPSVALSKLKSGLEQPHGMILVTGPTGSGKTTTLYAALDRLSTIERNVVTVEDPVEKRMPLLRQTEVNPKAGLTFAAGLRSILRQDPDVIMLGEIRDAETAELAVQAALTGHLVLSTLHTNSAAGAIVRLSEIGIPPFLITSSLQAVVAQRLVRRICSNCATEDKPEPRLIAGLGIQDPAEISFMRGEGCSQCLNTGYKGRLGLYEMLEMTAGLSSALLGAGNRDEIEIEAERALVMDLRSDGIQKLSEGLTTVEEVARIIGTVNVEKSEDLTA